MGLRCSKRFYGAVAHILLAPVQCCWKYGRVAASGCLVAARFNEYFTMRLQNSHCGSVFEQGANDSSSQVTRDKIAVYYYDIRRWWTAGTAGRQS